jgi:hypothetical protein
LAVPSPHERDGGALSPVLTGEPAAPPVPPPKPGWFAVAWATFLGYLVAGVIGLIGLVSFAAAGITLGETELQGRGLFVRYDAWSWLAEASVGLIAVGLTTLTVGFFIRQLRWEVGFGFTFLTLLVTGYAPAVALTPMHWAAAPVSLAVATFALRWRMRPSGLEPRTALQQVPAPHRRRVAIAVAIGVPAMALYAIGYSVTHPITLDTWDTKPYKRAPSTYERYPFDLTNNGPAEVQDLEIVRIEGTPALQLERVGIPANEWSWDGRGEPPPPPLRPISEPRLRRQGGAIGLEMELRQGAVCPPGLATVDAIWVRYRVLGGEYEQRLPLSPPPRVRCN